MFAPAGTRDDNEARAGPTQGRSKFSYPISDYSRLVTIPKTGGLNRQADSWLELLCADEEAAISRGVLPSSY